MKFLHHPEPFFHVLNKIFAPPWSFFHVLNEISAPSCSLITSCSTNRYYRVELLLLSSSFCQKICSLTFGVQCLSPQFLERKRTQGLLKLYIPSTLNIDLILWHTQSIVCADNVKSWFKSWVFPFTLQAYILPHTLNCMCISLFKFHIWILE